MSDINKLIIDKLKKHTSDVQELCEIAIQCAEQGLSEASIAEQLNSVVRNIIKKGVD